MDLNTILILSCVLTSISMVILGGFVVFLLRIATRGVSSVFGDFFGGNDDEKAKQQPATAHTQAARSSNIRARAQNLEFNPGFAPQQAAQGQAYNGDFGAQAAPSAQNFGTQLGSQPLQQGGYNAQFGAQAAQEQASGGGLQPLQSSGFGTSGGTQPTTPQAYSGNFNNPQQGLQSGYTSPHDRLQQRMGDALTPPGQAARPARPATPSLSSARPLNAPQSGTRPMPAQRRPGLQPLQSGFSQPSQNPPGQYNNPGTQPLQPGGFNAQSAPPQPPQPTQPQQQQQAPQGGLQPYRPSLSRGSALGSGDLDRRSNLRHQRGRDSGRRDDYDRIYDDGGGGIGGFLDDMGL